MAVRLGPSDCFAQECFNNAFIPCRMRYDNIMKPIRIVAEPLRELFKHRHAATLPELKAALGTVVTMTVYRKLSALDYRTSYSHRGAYYTLAAIPRFDAQGLWTARGAWFSRHGTLLDTVAVWVRDSPAGYFAAELEPVVHVPVRDALRQLTLAGRLARHELAGLYLYTARPRARSQEQRAARQAFEAAVDSEPAQHRAALVLFYSLLDEQQRRLFAGWESLKQGHGGDREVARILGLDEETVARGRRNLLAGQVQSNRVRAAGGGRPRAEKKRPPS
jgi:hypothetical protein